MKFHLQLQRALPPTLGALLFFLLTALLASEPAHAFGKRPVVVPPETPPSTPTVPSDVIRARWEGKARDGAAWSLHVFEAVPTLAPNLLAKTPADMAEFCPNYGNLNATDRKNFWVYLFSAIAQLESGFDPATVYTENFKDNQGNYIQSVGLLQLSITDNAYGCGFRDGNDIKDPLKNLDCGLRVMNKLVGQDGRIGGLKTLTSWAGGARYWSTLRLVKGTQVRAWTSALPMCGK